MLPTNSQATLRRARTYSTTTQHLNHTRSTQLPDPFRALSASSVIYGKTSRLPTSNLSAGLTTQPLMRPTGKTDHLAREGGDQKPATTLVDTADAYPDTG